MSGTPSTPGPRQGESRRINGKSYTKEISVIRRRYQVGSLERRNGVYRLRYRVDIIGPIGRIERRKRESITLGKISKRAARRKRDGLLAQHGIGNAPKAEMAFTDFWHYWPNAVEGRMDSSTQRSTRASSRITSSPSSARQLFTTSNGSISKLSFLKSSRKATQARPSTTCATS